MASRGLLGALGGLGAGVSQLAGTLFKVEIEKDRETRLQAIADKNYDRARTDQLADTASQREFQKGLLTEERGYLDTVRETEAGYVTATELDDEGNLKGITRSGEMLDLGQLSTVDPLLRPALENLKLAQADAARINLDEREQNPAVFDALEDARNQFNQALEDSRVRLGRDSAESGLDIGQFGGEAPPEALELLRSNPTLDVKMQFLQRYGYLPAL